MPVKVEDSVNLALCLPEGTYLNQYCIGKVLFSNGESSVYEAQANGTAWWIREFLPCTMVSRDPESLDLVPNNESQTIYKYSQAAFEEMFRLLCRGDEQKLEYIHPVEEMFHAHNTVYVVKKAVELKNLKEFAEEKGTAFTWTEAKKGLLPLLNSVTQLHDKGVVHLGIAPENLYITADGHLILSGFSTLEARTSDGELDQELYEGFSSPEQYEGGEWKGGTWSDVYALGAILYWMLCGEIPQSAQHRVENDELQPPMEKNPAIPENVSDAISGAMMLDPMLRAATVDDFTSALLESVSGNTTVYEVPVIDNNEMTVHLEAEIPEPKRHLLPKVLGGGLLFILLVLALGFGAYWFVLNQILDHGEEEQEHPVQEETMLYTVPDFVGHKYEDILNNQSYRVNFNLNPVQEYNDSYPAGVIVDQSVLKNTQVPHLTTIVLTVSKGKETVPMPNLIGWGLVGAKQQLDEAGIAYTVYTVENSNYTPNTVFRTDPPAGTELARSDATVVKIYITPEKTAEKDADEKDKKDNKKDKKTDD